MREIPRTLNCSWNHLIKNSKAENKHMPLLYSGFSAHTFNESEKIQWHASMRSSLETVNMTL